MPRSTLRQRPKSPSPQHRPNLIDGLRGGEDFLRGLVERVLQQVLDAETTSFLGAEVYERTGGRRGWRNGSKTRTLKTRVGTLELRVPKDRDG